MENELLNEDDEAAHKPRYFYDPGSNAIFTVIFVTVAFWCAVLVVLGFPIYWIFFRAP